MAWLSKDARDIPPAYCKQICHTTRDIKTVTCLICDNGYCKSEFIRKVQDGKGFFVSRHLIVCPAHPNLTFDCMEIGLQTNDQDDVETLLLNRKFKLIKKHLEDIETGVNVTQDIDFMDQDDIRNIEDDEISVSSENVKKRKYDNIVKDCVDCVEYVKELSHLKLMNKQLNQQNEELRDHNVFLRAFVMQPEGNQIPVIPSYANVLSKMPVKKPEAVQLVIKPNENYKGDALDVVQKQVTAKTKAKVIKMNMSKDGTVYIKCNSAQDSEIIMQTINKENNDILTAKPKEKNNPKIRITNIISDLGKEEIIEDIIERNQLPTDSINVEHEYKQKNNNRAILAEVSADAYAKIMRNKFVFVGYQKCMAYDDFNINMCKNCCGYNHSYKKCIEKKKRDQTCVKCAGEHESTKCKTEIKRCINCITANKYVTKKRSIDHSADEVDKCESFKIKWEQHVSNTNYPWRPDAPFKTN